MIKMKCCDERGTKSHTHHNISSLFGLNGDIPLHRILFYLFGVFGIEYQVYGVEVIQSLSVMTQFLQFQLLEIY